MDSKELLELKVWAEEHITNEPGEVFLGKDEVTKYEQVHLSINYSEEDIPHFNGSIKDYKEGARIKMAEEAKKNGCLYVVDGDDCQDNPKERIEILAGTGLREKWSKTLDNKLSPCDFIKVRMSHIDKEEFLRRMGENHEDYDSTDVHAIYEGKTGEDYLSGAEFKLAKKADKRGFDFVTNMDYTAYHPETRVISIHAKGLRKKK